MRSFINKFPPIHPVLFAILPVIYLYCRNIKQFPFHIILAPMAVLILVTMVLWFLGKKFIIIKDDNRLAIYISVFWLWFFLYDSVRFVVSYDLWGYQFYRHTYFIGIWFGVLLLIMYLTVKLKFNSKIIGELLTIISLLLVIFQVGMGLWTLSYHSLIFSGSGKYLKKIALTKENHKGRPLPSIFYIILDAYAGGKELKNILGFDNSNLFNYLESRGFYVGENSHCNFSWTLLSMSATLNMQYLPMEQSKKGEDIFELKQAISFSELIQFSQVTEFFKSIGYHIVNLSNMNTESIYYKDSYWNSFVVELLKKTIISRPFAENYIEGMLKRQEVKKQFKDLENVLQIEGPVFVYAHILVPHPPYVFSRDGSKPGFTSMVLQIESEKILYLDQVVFINGAIEKLVEKILSKSKTPPIIIIQGDHGAPRLTSDSIKNEELRMGILNAYYFPGNGNQLLYTSITPVNSFRVILNQYFGQHLPLLEDKSYYSITNDLKEVMLYDVNKSHKKK